MSKPQISVSELHKAQAIARHHAGQEARAQGYDPAAMRALASYGQPTIIGEGEDALTLLPQTLQVQLCLMEHAKVFPLAPDATVADGIERMAHLALIYSDPDFAFDLLTRPGENVEEKRLAFRREAFHLSRLFRGGHAIDQLSAHITAQMQLTDAVVEDSAGKKPPPPRPLGGPRRRR